MNTDLTKDINAQELKEALDDLPSGRAPGEDGLPAEFYIALWEEVGEDVYQACQEALKSGKLHHSLNTGLLCLIPKEGSKTNLKTRDP